MTNPLDVLDRMLSKINIFQSIDYTININKDKLIKANQDYLRRGQDSKGISLGEYANFKYKKRFEPVDLYLTGDFYSSFDVISNNGKVDVVASDWKTDKLKSKYGDNILGVPNDYEVLRGSFLDGIIFNTRKQLGI